MLFKALINYSFEIFGTESKIFEKIRFLPGFGVYHVYNYKLTHW